MKKVILFVVLAMVTSVSLASKYSDTPSQGSKGVWGWVEWVSQTSFKNGTHLYIFFPPKYQCKTAVFGVASNDNIYSMSFDIDGSKYRSTSPKNEDLEGKRISTFALSKIALSELKNGSHLKIDIGFGTINANLSGSALAFNSAFGNCMKELEMTSPQPSRIAKQKTQTSNFTQEENTKLKTTQIDGNMIAIFNGEFSKGDGPKIMQELTESGATLLILNSPGGLVSEAQMVGYYLRSNNIITVAGDVCTSACVYALAGGVERYAISESKVGIHRSKTPGVSGTLEAGQYITGKYIRYFNSMDIDTEIVAIASSTSSDGMHWLTMKEMINLNLITDNSE